MTGFVKDTFKTLTGGETRGARAARKASEAQISATREAIEGQREAAGRAQEYLLPLGGVGQIGLDQLGILTDPQQQMEYLQSNPLFQMSLDNANRQTMQRSAAMGRLSAGDTLQQLSNNILLSSQPLLQQQQRNIAGLLDFGRGVATTQGNIEIGQASQIGNLLGDVGNARAAGYVGSNNANQAFEQQLLQMATMGMMGGGGGGGGSFLSGAATRYPGTAGSVGYGGGIGL